MSDTNPELQAMSLPELLAQTVDCRNGHHSWTERGHGPCSACGEPSPPPVMPQLECGCLQGACHGGHTIDVGPPWVCIPEERLRQFRDDEYVCVTDDVRSMAAELLALRARVSSWSDRLQELTAHGAELDRRGRELEAAQREPSGYVIGTDIPGKIELYEDRVLTKEESAEWLANLKVNKPADIWRAFGLIEVDRVTDLFETWAAEENEHRLANEFGIAEGLKVAIDGLREAVHGTEGQANG